MNRIVELNKTLSDLNNESETIQRQIAEVSEREKILKKSIAEYNAKHNVPEIRAMVESLQTGKTVLKSYQNKLIEITKLNKDLDRQISEHVSRLQADERQHEQQIEAIVKYISSITFNIGNGLEHLSVKQFQRLVTMVVECRRNAGEKDDNAEYGKANYEIGALMKEGVITRLFTPLLDAVLYGLYRCLKNTFENSDLRFFKSYEAYSKDSNCTDLKTVIDNALEIINVISIPGSNQIVTLEWEDKITEILPQIIEIYCPVYQELKQIFFTDTSEFNWFDSLKSCRAESTAIKDILVELGLWSESIKNGLNSAYILTAAEYGFTPALKELARDCDYHTVNTCYKNNILWPVFNGSADTDYPSIYTGLMDGEEPIEHMMIDFFEPDTPASDNFISILYDADDQEECKIASTIMQSIMASVMAWIGPNKFTLDVIDFEYSGIGAYPAQFLPEKTVKIISRLSDWNDELDSLERIIEQRSRKMQSIFQYNRANLDKFEPFKIVVIQDSKSLLITTEEMPDYPDSKDRERIQRQNANVDRFIRFLELGYRYGIIFIVSSMEGYNHSTTVLNADELTSYKLVSNPYAACMIEGVDSSPSDYLMKWLAGGEGPQSDRDKVMAGECQDGSDGILATEIADDGTDIEFRMDTVSHTHAFVIGKTGSGKSVLLHNIITGLVNSYSPDDLELYLLDLKMGGVEFNRYRRLPHLRSLLVDNSDIQIVLEIMRDIDVMMRERGKEFRNAGVSNIKEYNRANPDKKMPQVIVIIDECHAIFSMGGGRKAAKEQREITERLVKIAKEGRSQGIHLIFATQTLSGSEIPSDIQKNITDYYLLKCAPSDSESLVRGSSKQTESLPVGKVYYYHADHQALFQGIYTDNHACEELIAEALRRYSGSKNHGRFYFNGAQTFELDKEIVETLKKESARNVAGSPGRRINLQQTPVILNLRKDYSENILLTGINSDEQLSRTTVALMASQIAAAKASGKELKVNVINCLDADAQASAALREMSEEGLIALYRPRESESLLKQLCESVGQGELDKDTMLYIMGQERYGELKRDQKFSNESADVSSGMGTMIDIFQGVNLPDMKSKISSEYDSFKKAIEYLLENGPSAGLHTVIQIDKPDRLLFDDFISAKTVSARFKHIVILRSDSRAAMSLGLSDDINVDTLSSDPERLRAFYYCDDDGSTRLFSPYEMVSAETLLTL